jgi:uncharacterized membrane protein
MMYWNGHMTTAGWIIAVIWTVIIFLLLGGAAYWFVTVVSGHSGSGGRPASGEASVREILDRRLARGELSIEQYEQLRDALDGKPSALGGEAPTPEHPAGATG